MNFFARLHVCRNFRKIEKLLGTFLTEGNVATAADRRGQTVSAELNKKVGL
jgi:hypothetical protein